MPLEVFELTEKGQEYASSLAVRLDPRLRAVLLKVDGKRTLEELSAYAKQFNIGAKEILSLEEQGLISERKLIPDQPQNKWGDFENSIMYDNAVVESEAEDFYHTITDHSMIHLSAQGAAADLMDQSNQPNKKPAPQKIAGLSIAEKLTDLAEDFFNKLPLELRPHELVRLHPRVFNRIDLMQHHPKDLLAYLDKLLLLSEDTRREGFSFQVIIELNNLKEHLEKNGKLF